MHKKRISDGREFDVSPGQEYYLYKFIYTNSDVLYVCICSIMCNTVYVQNDLLFIRTLLIIATTDLVIYTRLGMCFF